MVAGFWENSLIVDGEFHAQLLKRMLLNIKDVRPALLSETAYKILNELRGFRHVFRHTYSYGLDEERVKQDEYRRKRKEAGRIGAEARWSRDSD